MTSQLYPLEDQSKLGQQGVEGGDLSQKSADGGMDQGAVGAEDINRSLEQVAAKEAAIASTEAWDGLETQILGESPGELHLWHEEAVGDLETSSEKADNLLEIDTNDPNWEQLVAEAPDDVEILFTKTQGAAEAAGTIPESTTNESKLEGSQTTSETAEAGDSTAAEAVDDPSNPLWKALVSQESGLETTEENIAASEEVSTRFIANTGADASDLLAEAKKVLKKAQEDGSLDLLISTTFQKTQTPEAIQRAESLLRGDAEPAVNWATFNDFRILGAYVGSKDQILINDSLKTDLELALKTVTEEIGHWLDHNASSDTSGDEGELFAKLVFNEENPTDSTNDRTFIEIDGATLEAELSWQGTIDGTPVVGIAGDPVNEGKIVLTLQDGVGSAGSSANYFRFQTPTKQFSTSVNHVTGAEVENHQLVLTVNANAGIDWTDPSLELV